MVCAKRRGLIRRAFWIQRCFSVIRTGNERGIALVIALVMLLLLTILGAWALNTSSTDLRIAGNGSNTHNAFSCADGGIAVASNPNVLMIAYENRDANNLWPTLPVDTTVNSVAPTLDRSTTCTYRTQTRFLTKGQLPQGSAYDSDLDANGNARFGGLYFALNSTGEAQNSSVVVEAGVVQVVGN